MIDGRACAKGETRDGTARIAHMSCARSNGESQCAIMWSYLSVSHDESLIRTQGHAPSTTTTTPKQTYWLVPLTSQLLCQWMNDFWRGRQRWNVKIIPFLCYCVSVYITQRTFESRKRGSVSGLLVAANYIIIMNHCVIGCSRTNRHNSSQSDFWSQHKPILHWPTASAGQLDRDCS